MNEKAHRISYLLQKILFIGLLIGYGVILPLCFNRAYFDIMDIKAYIASLITIILLPLAIIILIIKIRYSINSFKNKTFIISLIIFGGTAIVSCLLSYDIENAFTGFQGWYIGTFIIVSMVIFILALYGMPSTNNLFYIPVLITIGFVYLFGVIDSFNIDILSFRENINPSDYHNYISTVGNINWYVGYLGLTGLFIISSYIKETNNTRKIIFLLLSVLAIYNIASIGSDGIYLAIYFSLFFLIPFIFNDLNRLKRTSLLLIIYIISLLILKYLNHPLNGYSAITIQYPFIIVCLLLSLICFVLSIILKNKDSIKRIIIVILEILLGLGIVILIIYVILNNDSSWGTGRIEIWEQSFKAYVDFPILNKLIGLGPELLNNVYARLSSIKGVIYQTSHSEPIQLLLTTGITGLLSWILCFKSIMIPYVNNKLWKDDKAPLYIALAAYLGQAFVNSATTLNIVTLVLTIIILNTSN